MKSYTIFDEIKYLNILLSRRFFENIINKDTHFLTRVNACIIKYLIDNENSDIFQKDIEIKFGITKSTASKVLKLMESKNLIVRQSVKNDARLKKLVASQKAKEIYNNINNTLYKDEQILLNNFSQEEINNFKNLLEKLKNNIKKMDKKGE